MEIIDIIMAYASMWAPAIAAVAGIIATVILAIGKIKKAIDSWTESNTSEQTTLDTLKSDLKTAIDQNTKLQSYNQKLLEELTRIKGYDVEV